MSGGKATHYLGTQHDSKPVLPEDKTMSKEHLKHRANVDKMKESAKKWILSEHYNKQHRQEHGKQEKKVQKKLNKLGIGAKEKRDLLTKMLAKQK